MSEKAGFYKLYQLISCLLYCLFKVSQISRFCQHYLFVLVFEIPRKLIASRINNRIFKTSLNSFLGVKYLIVADVM